MNRIGIALDQDTNDLFLTADGNLAMAQDAEAVGQHARQRIQTFGGEWYLDTTCGVPWLAQILGRRYDPALAEAVVKSEILNTDGVTEITAFSVSFDRASRGVFMRSVEVGTEYDEEVSL